MPDVPDSNGVSLPASSRVTPLWLETYLLELPFDVGLPNNFVVHNKDDAMAPVEPGWADFPLGEFLSVAPEPPTSQMQSTTLKFRQATVPGPDPLAAIKTAWPDVLTNAQLAKPRWQQLLLRSPPRRLWRRRSNPPPITRTMVRATRIAPPPASDEDRVQGHWRGDQFTIALRSVNQFLAAVAPASENLAVGPITAADLPPVLFGYRLRLPDYFARRRAPWEHFALFLHELVPWGSNPLTWEQADEARATSGVADLPFKAPLEWMRNARRSFLREQFGYAVIESGTAIELAISEAVRLLAPAAGYPATKLDNVLGGGFASRVIDHFAPLAGFDASPAQASDKLGNWWQRGYALRNRVAHRGYQPEQPEALAAVAAASELLDAAIERVYPELASNDDVDSEAET